MSKYSEMLAIMEFAKNSGKEEKPRRWRKYKKPDFFKQLMEFQEEQEKYQKWLKAQEKKDEKKEHKGLFPHDWSIGKRMVFLAVLGPPLGIGYVFGLVIFVRVLARFITG